MRTIIKKQRGVIHFGVRAAREAEKLSDQSIKRLLGVWRGERFVRRLGSGGTQNADLVLHPSLGLVVRKSATDGIIKPQTVAKSARRIKAAQSLLGHGGGIAKVHKVEPRGISYHEYVKGRPRAESKRKTIEWLKRELHRVNHNFKPNRRDIIRREELYRSKEYGGEGLKPSFAYARDQRLRKAWNSITNKELQVSPEQQEMERMLQQKGRRLWDVTPRNVIGRKIIDAEVSGKNEVPMQIGSAAEYPAHRAFKERKEKQGMKTKHLTSAEILIELARGDQTRAILEKEGWTGKDADPIRKRLYEAALYKPGYKKGKERQAPAFEKKVERLRDANAISPEQAERDISDMRKAKLAQGKKYRLREFIKADIETNASGTHGVLHKKLKAIEDAANESISKATSKEEQRLIKKQAQQKQRELVDEATSEALMTKKKLKRMDDTRASLRGAIERQKIIRIGASNVERATDRAIMGTILRDRDIRRNIAHALVKPEQRRGRWLTRDVRTRIDELRPVIEENAQKIASKAVEQRLARFKTALKLRAAAAGNATLTKGAGGASTAMLEQEAMRLTHKIRGVSPLGEPLADAKRQERLFISGINAKKRGRLVRWEGEIRRGEAAHDILERYQQKLRQIPEKKRIKIIGRLNEAQIRANKARAERAAWIASKEEAATRRYDKLAGTERVEKLEDLQRRINGPELRPGEKARLEARAAELRRKVATSNAYVEALKDRILGVRPLNTSGGERIGLRTALSPRRSATWEGGREPEGFVARRVAKPLQTLQDIVDATAHGKPPALGGIKELPGALWREGKQLAKNLGGAAWRNRAVRNSLIGAGVLGTAGALAYSRAKKKKEEEQLSALHQIIEFAKRGKFDAMNDAEQLEPGIIASDKEQARKWAEEQRELRHSKSRKRMPQDPDTGVRFRPMGEKFKEHVIRAGSLRECHTPGSLE